MNQFAIAAMGTDRPGIVAAVGEAILGVGGNIDDSSMTILGGHFAMLLVVQVEGDADQLESTLRPVAEKFELMLEVRTAAMHPFSDVDRDDYVVAAYGPDKPGLVSTISRVLAGADANINDFGSRLGADHTFAMWFNVSLAEGTDTAALGEQLRAEGRDLGLDIRLYRAEVEDL
ncbi:MAG: putative amino acid-binding protein [Thermoleophilia bacterium]|nr:putative amino acid-binding protein [Thermoleophilia bacterium]MCZ4497084.1 putative amino acid-binding protein [Thermoleophilia bacterium]